MAKPLINITSRQAIIFAGFLVLYEFLTYLANDMIMPGMIDVVKTFHAPNSAIANALTLYILGGASLQLFLGPISDRFGRRPVMIFGALWFALTTLLISYTMSMDQFFIARFFQGMGLCFISVIGYTTLQEIFAEKDAIRLTALMANVAILAPLLGPLMGAVFVHYYSWRVIFDLIGLGAVIALVGLWGFMPESVGQLSSQQAADKAALSFKVMARNYTFLLKNKSFMLGSLALGMISIPCVVWIALAPVILISDAKLSMIQYGVWQLPIFGATILGTWFLRALTHHQTTRAILGLGSILCGIGFLLLFLLPFLLNNHYLSLIPGFIIYFFGIGMMHAPLVRLTLFSTTLSKGTVSALMTLIEMICLAIGVELGNLIYHFYGSSMIGVYCLVVGVIYYLCLRFGL